MAKKKSKTQKMKKNLKRKQTKVVSKTTPKSKIAPKEEVIYNVAVTKSANKKVESKKSEPASHKSTKNSKIASFFSY